jgi:hypothetical protein
MLFKNSVHMYFASIITYKHYFKTHNFPRCLPCSENKKIMVLPREQGTIEKKDQPWNMVKLKNFLHLHSGI